MFKKLALVMVFGLACLVAKADELSIGDSLKKLPGMKQGIAFSLIDNKVNYLTTIEVLKFKDYALELGYAMDAESTGHKAVVVASAELINLKKLGVTIPVLDLIDFRLGAYAGLGRIEIAVNPTARGNNEFDAGVSLTAISVKF